MGKKNKLPIASVYVQVNKLAPDKLVHAVERLAKMESPAYSAWTTERVEDEDERFILGLQHNVKPYGERRPSQDILIVSQAERGEFQKGTVVAGFYVRSRACPRSLRKGLEDRRQAERELITTVRRFAEVLKALINEPEPS